MRTAPIEDSFPLSPLQQGMLFHYLYSKDSGVDIEQIVDHLHERLDIDALRGAWQQVVGRHAALRSSFRWEGLDQPLQDVHHGVELSFAVQDWRHLTTREQAQRLEEYLREDRQQGFVLEQPPAMRLALFQLADSEFQLVWTVHHILLDGRAFPIVLREVFDHYESNQKGQDLHLSPPPSYQHYIEWLQERDTAGDEAFWRERLAGFTRPTRFNTSLTSSSESSSQPGDRVEQEFRLSETQTSALRLLTKEHDLTLNTLVQGTWALLLSRYSGEGEVVFGATRACRRSTVPNAESIVGVFINTLPVRVRVVPEMPVAAWLMTLRQQQLGMRGYEHTPLVNIQKWSSVPADMPLFDSLLVFDYEQLNTSLRSLGPAWHTREFQIIERTNYPITVYAYGESELLLRIAYDRGRFSDSRITRMLGHIQTLLEGMAADPAARLASLPLLTARERHQLLVEWNNTRLSYPSDALLIHELFEAQVKHTPNASAIVAQGRQLTYTELNAKANQLAHYLISNGIGPDALVGICLDRSLELIIAILAIHKAGGAYLPMDPAYPKERLAFMMEDAKPAILLTQEEVISNLPQPRPLSICLDSEWDSVAKETTENPARRSAPDNLAYVIYTSGSTGKPKGVMVEHGNVINFFAGMDQRLGSEPPSVWLAVTSLSFDISVLELLWTLARGFKVVLYAGGDKELIISPTQDSAARRAHTNREIDFSLFYFASDEGEKVHDKYTLLLEGARFADEHGFLAVWTPERHFHAFGGLYPNPSVASAAIAVMTQQVKIRAGSVVLPLHPPIRVAEEWALVDNLSHGRVGISFASGWQPNDFVIAPENYADRKDVMIGGIETVRRLWRGETVAMPGPKGQDVEISTLPRPVQPELPIWLTAAGNPETCRLAGEIGANLLTHLLGQSVEELGEKVRLYREAWRQYGHGPGEGHVTLMLHTFVGADDDAVREIVRRPMKDYLRSAVDLVKKAAWHFPVRKEGNAGKSLVQPAESNELTPEDMEVLLDYAFERYFETSGLFGTPKTCARLVDRLREVGIDEIACLVDFGVDSETVLANLTHLNTLKEQCNLGPSMDTGATIPALIRHHKVTHLQCTPSMARMLMLDPVAKETLGGLHKLMIGGEAFSPLLAKDLKDTVRGDILNMYGPTETTVWSSTWVLNHTSNSMSIGRPIANTTIYIVDKNLQPLPVGVAGELMIGGSGVVRGYLNRPELTAERFICDPFSPDSSQRLYRTGDLARFLPDGDIEFIGRVDHQVKIRGHRIELGEIESVLNRHPSVRESVVIAREDVPGDKRLVAYVILRSGQDLNAAKLHDYVKAMLPDYMVPSHIMPMESFPQTPNRKIDRKALPKPGQQPIGGTSAVKAPTGELENTLATMWRETLGIEHINRNESFFAAGGHSLSAVQVISKIRQQFDVNLPLRTFFQQPTIAGLAAAITDARGQQARTESGSPFNGQYSIPRLGEDLSVRLMRKEDLDEVIALHLKHFPDRRNTKLGRPFLNKWYRWFMAKHGELALVAVKDGRVVGFTVGKTGKYRLSMLLNMWPETLWGVIRRPSLIFDKGTFDYVGGLATDSVARVRAHGTANGHSSAVPVADNRLMAASKDVDGAGLALIVAFEEAARRRGVTPGFHLPQ
jgi:natural product biosynthesis luciferase-like monooxygenase protein